MSIQINSEIYKSLTTFESDRGVMLVNNHVAQVVTPCICFSGVLVYSMMQSVAS